MANFDSGVKGYVKATATVEVHFPIDWRDSVEIACKHCPFFVRTNMRCGLNQSIVNFPSYRWTQDNYQSVLADIQHNLDLMDEYNNLLSNHDLIWNIYKDELKELRKIDFTPKTED